MIDEANFSNSAPNGNPRIRYYYAIRIGHRKIPSTTIVKNTHQDSNSSSYNPTDHPWPDQTPLLTNPPTSSFIITANNISEHRISEKINKRTTSTSIEWEATQPTKRENMEDDRNLKLPKAAMELSE